VTVFYKDIRDWVGTSPLVDTEIPSVKYSQFENRDYANVRGATIKLDKRYSHHFSAGIDYSYQIAEGTYANARDAFNAIQNQQEPRLSMISMPWDQNHTINGSIIYRLTSLHADISTRANCRRCGSYRFERKQRAAAGPETARSVYQ
jgi:hypothetical protein